MNKKIKNGIYYCLGAAVFLLYVGLIAYLIVHNNGEYGYIGIILLFILFFGIIFMNGYNSE
jgi:hypothetical protein